MKRLVGKVVLAVTAVAITVLAAEPMLRFLRPFNMNHKTFAMRYDPLLGWSKTPNLRGRYAEGDAGDLEALNSRGLRGPEYPYEKPVGEYRILVLGDSFAEGRLVAFHEMTSEVLKRTLNATAGGRRYQAISAGTGGYSTDQALLFFTSEGTKYAPDLTVLMFYENDVWYNVQPRANRGRKPFFRLEGERLVLDGVPVPPPDADAGSDERPARVPSLLRGLNAWLGVHSAVYQLVYDVVSTPPTLTSAVRGDDAAGQRRAAPVPDEFRVWRRKYDDETVHAWRVTEALLRELQREVRRIGGDFVVLYVPTAAEIQPERWAATREHYGLSEEDWDITRLESELEATCRRNGIHFVNPGPALRDAAARPWLSRAPLYFELDPHWTPEGHRVAGEVLAAYVREHLLPDGHVSAARVRRTR
jgi:hypothetical protein